MNIKDIKKGDLLKLKNGSIEHKVVEIGIDWRSNKDYVKIYNDVTCEYITLVDISNYESV